MNIRQLTPVECALLIGRARVYYSLRHPETTSGYGGIGRVRTPDSPETFSSWGQRTFGCNEKTLYSYNGLYKALGEVTLRRLLETNLNNKIDLMALKRMHRKDRNRYIARTAESRAKSREYITDLADLIGVPECAS